jgi:hypothetical protein
MPLLVEIGQLHYLLANVLSVGVYPWRILSPPIASCSGREPISGGRLQADQSAFTNRLKPDPRVES